MLRRCWGKQSGSVRRLHNGRASGGGGRHGTSGYKTRRHGLGNLRLSHEAVGGLKIPHRDPAQDIGLRKAHTAA